MQCGEPAESWTPDLEKERMEKERKGGGWWWMGTQSERAAFISQLYKQVK